jgi:hypothetical protein
MQKKPKSKRGSPKRILRPPDLDHSKASVLRSLGSPASKRTYGFAIDDFICWYCSEPRLAFGRTPMRGIALSCLKGYRATVSRLISSGEMGSRVLECSSAPSRMQRAKR